MTSDVLVIGAGPAGAMAAFTAARQGLRTVLVDRREPEGFRIGELLPGAAAQVLHTLGDFNPLRSAHHRRIAGSRLSWGSDALVAKEAILDPYGSPWSLDRSGFERQLRAAAVEGGATFVSAGVVSLRRDADGWHVGTSAGAPLRARALIDATGRAAFVGRQLGVSRRQGAPLVAMYRLASPGEDAADTRTLVEASSDGWWYSARLPDGSTLVAAYVLPARAAEMRRDPETWTRAMAATRHVSQAAAGVRFGAGLQAAPAGGVAAGLTSGDGWVACGDAAMAFDPISGQGLLSALITGRDAAMAVAGSLGGSGDLASYDAMIARVSALYRGRTEAVYQMEDRWAGHPFWRSHHRHHQAA